MLINHSNTWQFLCYFAEMFTCLNQNKCMTPISKRHLSYKIRIYAYGKCSANTTNRHNMSQWEGFLIYILAGMASDKGGDSISEEDVGNSDISLKYSQHFVFFTWHPSYVAPSRTGTPVQADENPDKEFTRCLPYSHPRQVPPRWETVRCVNN